MTSSEEEKGYNDDGQKVKDFLQAVKVKGETSSKLVIPWQEKVARGCGFKWPSVFWILVGLLVFLIQYLLVTIFHSTTKGLAAFGIYSAIISYAGILSIFNARRLECLLPSIVGFVQLPSDQCRSWYILELRRIFSFKRNLFMFVILGIPLVVTLLYLTNNFQLKQPWFGNSVSNVYAAFAWAIWCFVIVHHPGFVCDVVLLISRISDLPVKPTIYQYPYVSMKAIAQLMLFISTNYMMVISLILLGIWLSPVPFTWLALIWIVLGGIIVLSIFILPQFKLHKSMIREKNKMIQDFAKHIEQATIRTIQDPSEDNIKHFEKLYAVQARLNAMSEWPFDSKALITLLTTVVIPIGLVLFDIVVLR